MSSPRSPGLLHIPFFTSEPLSTSARQALIEKLWPKSPPPEGDGSCSIDDFKSYFEFLAQERSPKVAADHAVFTFEDVVSLVAVLRAYPDSAFDKITTLVQTSMPAVTGAPAKLANSVELALRIWLMFDVRNRMPSDMHHFQAFLPWRDDVSLKTVLNRSLRQHPYDRNASFTHYTNVHDMRRIGSFKVEWTSNLASHLNMRGSVIYIFHGVSVLGQMRASASTCVFLPKDFIDETLATIDLLIPLTKASCNAWLAAEIDRAGLDRNIMYRDPPQRSKSRYPYWQERLLAIEEAFEKSQPRSFLQWWHDTRDMQQWWGFWLVITGIFLTVLFGLIQSVTGIIQVVRPTGSS